MMPLAFEVGVIDHPGLLNEGESNGAVQVNGQLWGSKVVEEALKLFLAQQRVELFLRRGDSKKALPRQVLG